MDIVEILKKPESKILEFKRDLSSPDKILRTLVAFANTSGGALVIGVEDDKHIMGVSEPYQMEEKLTNIISDNIAPQLLPNISISPWRNTYLLSIEIYPAQSKPYYLKRLGLEQGAYIRVGSTNRVADSKMIAELQRVKMDDPFDKEAVPTLNSEALDFGVVSELFSAIKSFNKNDLETLDLITNYQDKKVPTIGGLILFGINRLKYFPYAYIKVGRFDGINKTTIRDEREITSYPILAIEEALEFVKKHAEQSIEITGARHKKKWSIPLTAVREALINAIVHADYSQEGAPIRLSIFDDRIEIENPGLLPFGLTVEEIKQGVSKLRNRVIGQVFKRLGLIEQWGSGVTRIIDLCVNAGLPEPLFQEIYPHFRVTIFTQPINAPQIDEAEEGILGVLKANKDGLSTKEISNLLEKSERSIRNRLIKLIEKGKVIEMGKNITDPKRKYFYKK